MSVILPCYNAEATLPACLDSLFSDPGVDLEVIAVNDHSKDGTLEVLRRYRETVGDRLKIFHNSENRGAYYCRNVGLHFATRDWVTFQDADDLSVHSRFSVVSEYVRLNPEVRMLYGYYRRIDSEGRILNVDGRYDLYGLITLTLKRKDALGAVGYYRPLRVAADSEYAKRAERNLGIDRVLRIHHCLYYATMSPDSLSGSLYRQVEGQPGHYVRAFAGDSARMAMMEEIRLKYELSQGPVPREDFTVDLGITRAV